MAGSLERRGKDSWRLEVFLGFDEEGNKIRKRKTVKAKNKTEAKDLLREFVTEVKGGEYIDPTDMKFGQIMDLWIENDSGRLAPGTFQMYEHIIEGHILPAFKNKKIDKILPMHIDNYLESLQTKRNDGKEGGLSSSYIQKNFNILSNVFKFAHNNQMIKHNPMEKATKPKVQYKKYDVYSTEEVLQLMDLLENEEPQYRLMIKIAIYVGLRRGEILALQWEDIDFNTHEIHIHQSLSYTKDKGLIIGPPKNGKERVVVAPAFLIKELKEYHLFKKKERLQAAELWEGGKHFFVFSSSMGKPYFPSVPSTWWRRFLDRTNKRLKKEDKPPFKRIRLHDLRHTAATLLINQGEHPKIIAERLGHADIQMTMNTYGHFLKEADQGAADKLNNLFSPKVL